MPAPKPLRRSICVFCGSRAGARTPYAQAAEDLGALIAARGWRLVFGAGDVGLMGKVARAAEGDGAETFGVIPVHLMPREAGRRDPGRLIVTETMHERKKVMFMNSDALVVPPGGAGTLDEFFEVLTWRQIGLHEKPIFLLNVDGYWSPLLALIEQVIDEGFADASLRAMVRVVDDVSALDAALQAAFAG